MLQKNEIGVLVALLMLISIMAGANLFLYNRMRILFQPPLENISVADVQIKGELTEEFQEQLQMLPKPILQSFIANRWTLCIGCGFHADAIGSNGFTYSDATEYHRKTIHLQHPTSLLHEFGHYTQYIICPTEEWKLIYGLEAAAAASILGTYATENHREYFAEVFEYYIVNQRNPDAISSLQKVAPKTTEYFKSLDADNWSIPTSVISIQPFPQYS